MSSVCIILFLASSLFSISVGSYKSLASFVRENRSRKSTEKPKCSEHDGSEDDSESDEEEAIEEPFTVSECTAYSFPFVASASLLLLFLFFQYFQNFLCLYIIIVSVGAVYTIITWYLGRKFPYVKVLSLASSLILIVSWVFSNHYLLANFIGVCLSMTTISIIRVPSLKISSIILVSLLIYDVFWVFVSPAIFNRNVMVDVATQSASNPIHQISETIGSTFLEQISVQHLDLPLKLIFPSELADIASSSPHHVHMLGLGDIVIPGLFIAFALRLDWLHFEEEDDDDEDRQSISSSSSLSIVPRRSASLQVKRGYNLSLIKLNRSVDSNNDVEHGLTISTTALTKTSIQSSSTAIVKAKSKRRRFLFCCFSSSSSSLESRLWSFMCNYKHAQLFYSSIIGYMAGLIVCTIISRVYQYPQPALLYLVPFILAPMIVIGYAKKRLSVMWNGVSCTKEG